MAVIRITATPTTTATTTATTITTPINGTETQAVYGTKPRSQKFII